MHLLLPSWHSARVPILPSSMFGCPKTALLSNASLISTLPVSTCIAQFSSKKVFQASLDDLHSNRTTIHDPGFICSLYLVLALGTLSEASHLSSEVEGGEDVTMSPPNKPLPKGAMPPEWPDHDEFFKRALGVKPDLKVTISSLQALILLHLYLYTEV
ncbi:hypothetical protein BDZ89DRAFT_1220977, partial [Hymenopellis radicata]